MEDELHKNEQAKHAGGKKQRIPPDLDFTLERLLDGPEQEQGGGAGLHYKDRPGFDGTKRERPKQKQAENSVEQRVAGVSCQLAAAILASVSGSHEVGSEMR